MRYYIENGISITFGSRFGRVESYSECNKICNAKDLKPFKLQDFYNHANSLNQTNFLFYKNGRQANSTVGARNENQPQKRKKIYLCTDVQYDFGRRKWTDGSDLESSDFIQNWKNKFQQLWDHHECDWPPQPYQPELVVLTYDIRRNNGKVTASTYWFGLSQAWRNVIDEGFYKCFNRNYLQHGLYDDAIKDCENSNSSFQTYLSLNQVKML